MVLDETETAAAADLWREAIEDMDAGSAFGDPYTEQFEAIQRELEVPVRRFVRRLTRNSDAVDDIVQETFIALYRHLPRINPPERVRAYAFGIARKRCYDELRRRSKYEHVTLEEEPSYQHEDRVEWAVELADSGIMPDEATYWLLLRADVQRAIDRLPEVQRQVLILYCEEELSYAEIAEIMGVNVGTVKSRLHYAKRALRGLLPPATLNAIHREFNDEHDD
jgi:RNA polymerase sigma-70 factor (ECF subfamily)